MGIVAGVAACAGAPAEDEGWEDVFDGASLAGWEGNTDYFRVEDGVIVGGILTAPVPRNEFLCREEERGDFEMRLRFTLGPGVNSGVQFHSQRIPESHETIGYQADLGDGYWAALYDESRRNTVLAAPDPELIDRILIRDGWNDYHIVTRGGHIQLFLNGEATVDYHETDPEVPQAGRICLQIHSGPAGEARFSDLAIRDLDP